MRAQLVGTYGAKRFSVQNPRDGAEIHAVVLPSIERPGVDTDAEGGVKKCVLFCGPNAGMFMNED